ncbi:MAG TPA: transcriptional regulator [Verrucomicrobiales bacterium]|nr:transcriptional regulator [Verrucomicrobiales bacterium]
MSRKNLIPLLSSRPMSLREIAAQLGQRPADVEDDLRHLTRSLVHTEWTLTVVPATCRKCGFRFGEDKLHKPSKCPACKGTWLAEPVIGIGRRAD